MALLAILMLLAGACGSNDDPALEGGEDSVATTSSVPQGQTALPRPRFEPGTTMAALQSKGKIVIGTKFDQPPLGVKNPVTNEVEGFDVEIGKLMAVAIFGGRVDEMDTKIEFVEARTPDRETLIKEGKVDIVVATYSITDARKQQVDFAGPYLLARQDVMVTADDTTIKSPADLNGKKVCSVTNSTSIKNILEKAPQSDIRTSFERYSLCAEALADGRVDAVTTDDVILLGLAKDNPGKFKVLGVPFTNENYGIGVKKGDDAFRAFLNDRIEAIYKSGEWRRAAEGTFVPQGQRAPEPPPVDRYTTGAAATTTTAGSGGGTSTSTSTSTSARANTTTTTTR